MSRKPFPRTVGTRPFTVRITVSRGLVSCQWRGTMDPVTKKRKRPTKSWPDSPDNRKAAIAWATDYADERRKIAKAPAPPPPPPAPTLTLAALWEAYRAANAADWRPKTAAGYAAHAATACDIVGAAKVAADLTLLDLDAFKARQRARGIAHNQVRRQVGFLRQLVNWAEGRDLIARNRLRAYRYKVPLDERGEAPAEYDRGQLLKVAAELAKPQHWRARAAITLAGSLGARVNAILHLCWPDVDFRAGTVTWQPEWDKLGNRRVQPLTPRARAALEEALTHRHATEAWVFWAVRTRGRPYHYNSLHHHLTEAEDRAGVAHIPGRAFHGLRRMVVGDIGDLRHAGAWIGQASLKVTASYDRTRAADVEAGRAAIEGVERVPDVTANVISESATPTAETRKA